MDRYPVSRDSYAGYPVSSLTGFFNLTPEEKYAMMALAGDGKQDIEETLKNPPGTIPGFNVGAVAGRSVMHCHCPVFRGIGAILIIPTEEDERIFPGNVSSKSIFF